MAADRGAPDPADEHLVDREVLSVSIRSTPRYERMLLVGVLAGLLAAIVMTVISGFTEDRGGPMSSGASGVMWVFGVYAAIFIGAGLLVAGVVSIVLSRSIDRSVRIRQAQHDTTLVHDLRPPATDDPPRWVGQADDLGPSPREPRRRSGGGPAAPDRGRP